MSDSLALFDFTVEHEPPTSPKQFELKVIRAQTACDLNAKWHSRLPIIDWSNVVRNTHYVCFGLMFEGEYFASAIWSSPVAQNRFKYGKQMLELRRMAVSNNCPYNTATWMLARMRKHIQVYMPDIALLVSYQDTEVHSGTIYKADNWSAVAESPGMSWTTGKRDRNVEQSLAVKVRWEYKVKNFVEIADVESVDEIEVLL
jgi:hypothetical protein